MEDGLCSTVPCVIEFSKAPLRKPMTVSYRLNENISFHVGTSQPSGPMADLPTEEVEYCILLTHNMLGRKNMTYSLYVGLGAQKGTVVRVEVGLAMSHDARAHSLSGLGSRKSRGNTGDRVTSPGTGLYKTFGRSHTQV